MKSIKIFTFVIIYILLLSLASCRGCATQQNTQESHDCSSHTEHATDADHTHHHAAQESFKVESDGTQTTETKTDHAHSHSHGEECGSDRNTK